MSTRPKKPPFDISRARLASNRPHRTAPVAWAISNDGRYLATGTSFQESDTDAGNIAIWELDGGRCVNVIHDVEGGVGWPGHRGALQWSSDDVYLGLAFETNSVSQLRPFELSYAVYFRIQTVEGWDRPPHWRWSSEGMPELLLDGAPDMDGQARREVEAALGVVLPEPDPSTPDLQPFAWSPGSTHVACIIDSQLQVWRCSPLSSPQQTASIDVGDCRGVFFGAEGRIAVSSPERLIFFEGALTDTLSEVAEVLLAPDLADNDPVTARHLDSGLTEFRDGRVWGYFIHDIIITPQDPTGLVHWSVARRYGWPLAAAETMVFESLEDAVEARPELFTPSILDEFGSPGPVSPVEVGESGVSSQPALDGAASEAKLVEFLTASLATAAAHENTAPYWAEVAVYHARQGRFDEAATLLDQIELEGEGVLALARASAYLARAGAEEYAELYGGAAQERLGTLHRWTKTAWPIAAAWLGATHHALTGSDGGWIDRALKLANSGPDSVPVEIAPALACCGQWERAFEIVAATPNLWWHQVAGLVELLVEADDRTLVERFWATLRGRDFTGEGGFVELDRALGKLAARNQHGSDEAPHLTRLIARQGKKVRELAAALEAPKSPAPDVRKIVARYALEKGEIDVGLALVAELPPNETRIEVMRALVYGYWGGISRFGVPA